MNIWGEDSWPAKYFTHGDWEQVQPKCECGTKVAMGEAYPKELHSDYCPVYISWKARNNDQKTEHGQGD
jgi:hypothetical protein